MRPKRAATAEASRKTPAMVVVGVGNACQADDAAGLLVARELQRQNHEECVVREHNGEIVALMDDWEGAEVVILVDAVQTGGRPGSLYRFDVSSGRLPYDSLRHSTHAISLGDAIELARVLDRLPAHLIVYGIEAKDFTAGREASPAVKKAIPEIARRISEELALHSHRSSGAKR